MISTSYSSSFTSSAPLLLSPKVVTVPRHSQPSSVTFRPLTISASCSSTVERPAVSHIASSSSLYDVLGIPMGATNQEIKTAYRRLARLVHPDVAVKPNGSQSSPTSPDEFLKVHEAYSTLSHPQKRADYDRLLCIRRRPVSSPVAMSSAGCMRQRWETDQCW